MPRLGTMNIAAYAGRRFQKIPLTNKRDIGMVRIGFALNATTNILVHRETFKFITICSWFLVPALDEQQYPETEISNMAYRLEDLTINSQDLDLEDICSAWQWRIAELKSVILISKLGDMFLLGKDDCAYWLQTDSGDLTKVADTLRQFKYLLEQDENLDNWFLPTLINQLEAAGKILGPNQIYSFKKLPVIGGEYSIDNIDPTDISVHFAFSGQICEQIQNLPDGTKVKITIKK
jgi:hypothetical protein